MLRKSILLSLLTLLLLGCNSKIYFTPSIKKQLLIYNQPLNEVQFFIDKKISLKNQTVTIDSNGNKTYYTKIIHIKRNTPGLCINVKDSLLIMQFEQGESNNLIFGVKENPKPMDHYKILAYNWTPLNGVVKYEDLPYNISIKDAFASLKIKSILLSRLEKKEVNKRTIKGLTLEEVNSKK
jgi:hypothetical protein